MAPERRDRRPEGGERLPETAPADRPAPPPQARGRRDRPAQAPAPDPLLREVARKGARRERSRREGRHGIGYGLGMFGLIGWSVAVPTILGIALGVWIDRTTGSPYSWTLMLMLAGVAVGCFNAWYWLRKEAGLDDDER